MYRIACVAAALIVQLVLASSAIGATFSIAPTSGPAGTGVTFQGVASECAERSGADAEVFLLLGPLPDSTTAAPRTAIEPDELGAFNGTWVMPDPVRSFARDGHATTFPVGVRCIDEAGAADGVDITPDPPSFTYTGGPCTTLQHPDVERLDAYLDALGACLRVALRGTGMDNALFGNALANVIDGLAGNDVLRGLDGNDVIRGGTGNDRAFGDAGNDRIGGGPGIDTLQGGAGTDTLNANDARGGDVVDGGAGTDTCSVNEGDTVRACERVVRR